MSTHRELDQGFQGLPEPFPGIIISNTMMASVLPVSEEHRDISI